MDLIHVAVLEAALTKWSIAVQAGVVAVLVVVFGAAWFSTRRRLAASWSIAWLMDALALFSVLVVALFSESFSHRYVMLVYAGYAMFKLLFGAFLVLGLYQYRLSRGIVAVKWPRWVFLVFFCFASLLFAVFDSPVSIQNAVYLVFGLMLVSGGLHTVFTCSKSGAQLVAVVFLIHGILFLHHGVVLLPHFWGGDIPAYMSHVSFIDAVSEFMVGLGCVMATGWAIIEETVETNRQLENVQKTLRSLVDSDSLTGLYNRRRMRGFLTAMKQPAGMMIFIDVDQFKMINDGWGHAAGDECLQRIADGLRAEFRPQDGLFRIGGDEFLVIVPGLDEIASRNRVARLRSRLANPDNRGIPIQISVGMARFDEQTPVDEALDRADSGMYRDKANRKGLARKDA